MSTNTQYAQPSPTPARKRKGINAKNAALAGGIAAGAAAAGYAAGNRGKKQLRQKAEKYKGQRDTAREQRDEAYTERDAALARAERADTLTEQACEALTVFSRAIPVVADDDDAPQD